MRAFWIVTLNSITLSSTIYLSGCAAPIAAIGASSTAAASSAGTSIVAAAAANPVTATSVASTVTTGKSPLEHAASAATKKECSFTNIIGPKPICEDVVIPKVIDKSAPLTGPADLPKGPGKQ
ncbi:hypothetical protein DCO17_04445 [Polynucleobacter tropicus]|uniref:Uncharacterized protein n=1 Tax=Polynucleobacter tropicus TaxID=1743174 RepID=A0A6M9PYY2_9BURK|nr:hypothetical protein [Polynucleobacter tropicus]QKM64548.1 hypothetical protein DCO17_04445 [Polynucleobacter tropicus]